MPGCQPKMKIMAFPTLDYYQLGHSIGCQDYSFRNLTFESVSRNPSIWNDLATRDKSYKRRSFAIVVVLTGHQFLQLSTSKILPEHTAVLAPSGSAADILKSLWLIWIELSGREEFQVAHALVSDTMKSCWESAQWRANNRRHIQCQRKHIGSHHLTYPGLEVVARLAVVHTCMAETMLK